MLNETVNRDDAIKIFNEHALKILEQLNVSDKNCVLFFDWLSE
jgi:hypothetical protein